MNRLKHDSRLTLPKLTEYGAASSVFAPSKEDERSTALAARARKGDYDDGMHRLVIQVLKRC